MPALRDLFCRALRPRRAAGSVVAALSLLGGLVLAVGTSVPAHAAGSTPSPNPFFGTWSDGLTLTERDRASSQARLDDVSAAGLGLVRQYIWWNRIERQPGVYTWTQMDQLVSDATARGVQILPTLLYTPDFYSAKPEGSTSTSLFPPKDPQDLANFATAMVKRYGTHGTYWNCTNYPALGWKCDTPYAPIMAWEVWNEPDYPSWWGGHPDPVQYLDMLKVVSNAVHAADPAAKVVLGAMANAGGATDGNFLEQLYQMGGAQFFDLLSLNPYGRDVGSMMAFIHGERDIATRYGDVNKQVLITEYGWATGGKSAYLVTDDNCQAALLYAATTELYRRRDELKIYAVSQFQWQDVTPPDGPTPPWPDFAGVRTPEGAAKPSLDAMKAAVAGQPAPSGLTLAEACPADRQSLDGYLQMLTVTNTGGTGSGVVTSSPGGITCGDDCTQQEQPGSLIALTATPADGSYVKRWTGADCSGATCNVTMDAAQSVGVVFGRLADPGTYQENDPLITYTGDWRNTRPGTRDSGGAVSWTTTGPAAAELRFRGTGVQWVSRRGPTSGINAVSIDGQPAVDVDRYRRVNRYHRVVFDSGDLAPGEHAIRIEYTGTKRVAATDDNVVLDAFIVR